MKELDLKEVQQIAYRILCDFDIFCQENSLRYSLGGGTLLGAVRHKGFIPWDDDIDLMMPRPDYEKFLTLSREKELPFVCLNNTDTVGYDQLFCKLSDKATFIEDETSENPYEIGVSIDIFPIDGLGKTYNESLKIFNETKFFRELLIASRWTRFFRSKSRPIWIEPIRYTMYFLSRFVNSEELSRKTDLQLQKYDFETSTYAACISGVYREKEIMATKVFQEYIKIQFQDNVFWSIANYHDYLTQHYGEYMELPPENKQFSHHTAKFFNKRESND